MSLQPSTASSSLSCVALRQQPALMSLSISGSAWSSQRANPAGTWNCSEVSETQAPQQGIVVWNWRTGVARAVSRRSRARSVPLKRSTAMRMPAGGADDHLASSLSRRDDRTAQPSNSCTRRTSSACKASALGAPPIRSLLARCLHARSIHALARAAVTAALAALTSARSQVLRALLHCRDASPIDFDPIYLVTLADQFDGKLR